MAAIVNMHLNNGKPRDIIPATRKIGEVSMSHDTLGPQKAFEAYLADGKFMIQKSRSTGAYLFWPRVLVPGSGEDDLEWVPASGMGRVYSITVNRKREGNHNVALIDLDEGPRMMSIVAGVESIAIGARVRARIEVGDMPRVVFDPVGEDA